ncbi:MAG TPA: peptidoglycan DD-metalloendopeptidase family protein [Thiohalobacter sp.]|nr:peptidoglycan DD-metalloendopeptidase family protein [Thiohalobacter sp.]
MRPDPTLRPLLLALLLAGLPSLPAAAEAQLDPEQASARLEALRERIQAIERRLDRSRAEESRVNRSLREVETRLSRTRRELAETSQRLEHQQARLQALQQEQVRLGQELARHREGLEQYLRTAFMLGRQESIKLVLNQEDPQRLGRTLTYYRYLARDRAEAVSQARRALQELAAVERDVDAQLGALEATRARRAEQHQQLERQQAERSTLLTRLRREIRTDQDQLARMEQDEQRLQALLEELRRALDDVRELDRHQRPFASLRSELAWPVSGKLVHRFGQAREHRGLRWRGVFIATGAGEAVRAVARGRVAFADWLRGFGLLVIVDHGDGYMSLYGHNQALFREPGDWIEGGEVLARVGDTGGALETGLYFELRHEGRPIDPLKWCAGEPTDMRAGSGR